MSRRLTFYFFGCLLLAMLRIEAYAQTRELKGTVTDSTGSSIVGATINVKDTNVGTKTGSDGSFSLSAPSGATTLVVSYIGYETKEVAISSEAMNIVLSSSISTLEEVTVVSTGYGTLDKREVTSAITHIKGEDLNLFGGNAVLNSMQGKVAGLSVVNTAQSDPNASPSIQLRGASSRNAGLGPLYVINGVPGGNIDNLNQNPGY